MSKTQITSWDVVDHLGTDEDIAAYLEAALEDGDPQLVAAALEDTRRAKGRTKPTINDAGLSHEGRG